MKVSVYQESINREFEEYLVNFDYFIALMKDYGFTPVSEINISKNKKIPSIGTFKNIDDSLNKEFNMSEEEKIISYLNNYFIFQNTGNLSDIAINQVYNHYMDIQDKNLSNEIGHAEDLNLTVELK